jgi:hypothetical protein
VAVLKRQSVVLLTIIRTIQAVKALQNSTKEKYMKLGKEFVKAYADFSDNGVVVEIPFICNEYAGEFFKSLGKCYMQAKLKGNFTVLATSKVIVGFCYDYAENETREYVEKILEVFSGLIMMRYYDQLDKSEVMEIPFAIAA